MNGNDIGGPDAALVDNDPEARGEGRQGTASARLDRVEEREQKGKEE